MNMDLNTDIEPEIEDPVKNPEYSNFISKYLVNDDVEPIGVGGFSVVKEATSRSTGEKVAVKIVPACYATDIKREAETMKKIQNPHILQMYDIFSAEKNVFMVTELAIGGDLFGIVEAYTYLPEAESREITRRVLLGVEYLHSRGVVHRDLKPQNILCCSEQDITQVKIGDFGLSKILSADSLLKTRCGSPHYLAPEVLTCPSYDSKVDIWSVGVIAYVMLTGSLPFYSEDIREVIKHVMLAEYTWPEDVIVSGLAKDFVRRLVDKDPNRRPTASECLNHPWITMGSNGISIGDNISGGEMLSPRMNSLNNNNGNSFCSSKKEKGKEKDKEKKKKKKSEGKKKSDDVKDDAIKDGDDVTDKEKDKKSKRHHHKHKHKHKHDSDSDNEDGGGSGDGEEGAEEKPKKKDKEKKKKKKSSKKTKDESAAADSNATTTPLSTNDIPPPIELSSHKG